MKAMGCHVFAGGFTLGVRDWFDIEAQLEIHGLGKKTVESWGIPFIMAEDASQWPPPSETRFLFGNPRCTGFSCVSGGCGEHAHGPWSGPTRDIHDLCGYGVKHGFECICWESVQQAISVGRPLLDYLRDALFVPNGYRIAHVLLNAASFGNAQHRKRYFFFAYRADRNFNVLPPVLPARHATVWDVIGDLDGRPVRPAKWGKEPYDPDTHRRLSADDQCAVPYLPPGWDYNMFCDRKYDLAAQVAPNLATIWDLRTSCMPFSMHGTARLKQHGFMPVISSTSARFIHPTRDRPITVREATDLMGWDGVYPIGPDPFAEIGKGIVPAVGSWLAQQALAYLNDEWADEDYESRYCDQTGMWEGRDTHGYPEKTFDLTRYCPPKPITEKVT